MRAATTSHDSGSSPALGATLAWALLGWAAVVAFFTLQELYAHDWLGAGTGWRPALLRQALSWAAWGALVPIIIRLARRFPVRGDRAWPHILAHGALGLAAAVVHSFLVASIFPLFYYAPSVDALHDVFWDRLYAALTVNVLVYAALVATVHASDHARESRRREVARAELEARVARAELGMLAAQLQPHFLFNALTSVVELAHEGAPQAAHVARDLASLLRRALVSADTPTTSLDDELQFLGRYIAIQQTRFPRLSAELHADGEVRLSRIPPMLLQPLVENAIRFSVGATGTGSVRVSCIREGDALRIDVTDDGIGFDASTNGAAMNGAPHGTGLGLANTRARLERLYGADFALAHTDRPDGGAVVSLSVPAHGPRER